MTRRWSRERMLALALALSAFAAPSYAMQHGGGPPGGGGGKGGPGGGGMGGPGGGPGGGFGGGQGFTNGGTHMNPNASPNSAGTSMSRFAVSLGPTGRWWDDKKMAKKLSLRPDQQQKMDDVFESSKGPLFDGYRTLQLEEARLDAVTHEDHPDEQRIFAQIDRMYQARVNVEKQYAHLMLQIRNQMDSGQVSKLEKEQKDQ